MGIAETVNLVTVTLSPVTLTAHLCSLSHRSAGIVKRRALGCVIPPRILISSHWAGASRHNLVPSLFQRFQLRMVVISPFGWGSEWLKSRIRLWECVFVRLRQLGETHLLVFVLKDVFEPWGASRRGNWGGRARSVARGRLQYSYPRIRQNLMCTNMLIELSYVRLCKLHRSLRNIFVCSRCPWKGWCSTVCSLHPASSVDTSLAKNMLFDLHPPALKGYKWENG